MATAAAEVELFKQFLRINTMHPKPNLGACVSWLKSIADESNFAFQTVEFVENLPIVIVSRLGTDTSLPSIGLNCHMDVVPVVAERWDKLPAGETPFSAWEDKDGKIYARGAQDMKCVGAQYLCALKRIKQPLLRTVHTIWVPDEEIGGEDGMKKFVTSPQFRSLNLACVMDEGLAFDEDKFVVFTGERTSIWAKLAAVGPVGHGSKLISHTAFERISAAITKLSKVRQESVDKLERDPSLSLGDVTTVNITVVQGGTTNDGGKTFAPNVIPSDAFMIADIRVALEDFSRIVAELKTICRDNDLTMTFVDNFDESVGPSPHSDRNSVWMRTIEHAVGAAVKGVRLEKAVFPAATDSRYVRRVGIPAFGFSPMRKTPSLLHDHNEYLERTVYLEGVDVMTSVVEMLANVPPQPLGKL